MATTSRPLIRLEQHMLSKYAAKHLYSDKVVQKAPVATGITMAYAIHESENEAPKGDELRLVMVMGYSYCKEEWAPTIDALLTQWEALGLETKLKILTFDNRGVGGSDAPWGKYSTKMMAADLEALLDHVGWQKAHILGTSMGGMISQELALRAPERLLSLELVTTSRGRFCPDYSCLGEIVKTMVLTDKVKVAQASLCFVYTEEYMTQLFHGEVMRDILIQYHLDGSAARGSPPTPGALGQTAALVLHYVSDDQLHQIRGQGFPILILGAGKDLAITPPHNDLLKRELAAPHVTSVDFPEANHAVFLQYIDEYAAELIKYLRSITAGDAA
ncbi:hypothetical protein BBJ28_00000348 [Nothophytophthora sp. Chile5]|nr:hypothetical protein BBJ28_00000348 [Nothophytophthora sp. Chile5]